MRAPIWGMLEYPRRGGVYVITCAVTGEQYVGATYDFFARWEVHRISLRGGYHQNPLFQAAWNLHGEKSFYAGVLEWSYAHDSHSFAFSEACEVKWIKNLRSSFNRPRHIPSRAASHGMHTSSSRTT
jgi:hypothetical protein